MEAIAFPNPWAETNIGERFAAVAVAHADRPAIVWPGGAWSYAQLAERSRLWAGRLGASASMPERPAAILLPRGAEMVAALLGAATVGRPWTILPDRSSASVVRATLEAVGACDLVSDRVGAAVDDLTNGLDVRLVEPPMMEESAQSTLRAAADAPAAICFTSGSTGAPKGVVFRHDSTVWNAHHAGLSLGMDEHDRYLWLSSPANAATCSALFCTLLRGACLLPFDVADRGFPALAAWVSESRATILHSIPSLFRRFARSVVEPSLLASLRVVKLGGEPLFPADVALFGERMSADARLVNGLGMSEANGNVCHEPVSRDEHFEESVPIGRALAGFELTVRDEEDRELPPGEAGHLRIVGASLAQGYWDAASSRAVPFPSLGSGGKRIFHAPDVCRQLEDGRLVHLGRSDGIVKVRGIRVSLAGVEARVREIAGVGDVLVDAGGAEAVEPRIAAWIEPVAAQILSPHLLREQLAGLLPREAVPTQIEVVEHFPLLPGGKVDRRALLDDQAVMPAGPAPIESDPIGRMAACFAEAVGRPSFGAEEDFFKVGGDSLAAATLAAAVETEWSCCLDPATLAAHPTPAGLVAALGGDSVRPAFRLSLGGEGLPLWLIGGAGDPSFHLLPLARAVAGRAPIYGFLAGVDANGRATTRVDEMTAPMFEALRRLQPSGPYLLAATSFGGWLAFDLARRLLAAGEKVAFLGMLDASAPGYRSFAPSRSWAVRKNHWKLAIFRHYRRGLAHLGARQYAVAIARRAAALLNLARNIHPDRLDPLRRAWMLEEGCRIAKLRYRLGRLPAKITAFQAEPRIGGAARGLDPSLGWSAYSQQPVRTVAITGPHGAHMRDPHVRGLATALIAEINRVAVW